MKIKLKDIEIPIFKHLVTLISGDFDVVRTYLHSVYGSDIGDLNMALDKADALCLNINGNIFI